MNAIQRYFRHRQNLIEQYVQGDMTKAEYLKENLRAVLALNIEPFKNLDSVEKSLFNYQYYNAMAKEAKRVSKSSKDYQTRYYYEKEAEHDYYMKDKATRRVLELMEYRNMTAYFIKVRSRHLKGKLFEILLEDSGGGVNMGVPDKIVLHSASGGILNRLRSEGVFTEEKKNSIIDHYINQRYY